MSEKTLFQKIIDRELPADILYEDDLCIAIKDINPQAPVHLLLIPKEPIDMLINLAEHHKSLMGHLLYKASELAREHGIYNDFRLVVNNGEKASQTVFHLHMHILGGRNFIWPPG